MGLTYVGKDERGEEGRKVRKELADLG